MSEDKKNITSSYTLEQLRHSTAHLLAHAVVELFPSTQLTIGPATTDGFFYDLLPTENFKLEDLPSIEKKMHEIAKRNLPITHFQMSKKEACELFKNNPFKLELINGITDETVGIAQQGDFIDLCKGGHVASTKQIKFFKLHAISGSYWRADKTNTALQRIHGTAFFTKEDLDLYEAKKEAAILYDHRKLGKQLDYFSFHDEGVGFPFFHHKGKIVLNALRHFMRSILQDAHYCEIETPTMLSDELWRCSGHYEFYRNNMYFSNIDEKNYAVKPMNCPGSILIYKERPRSYRELPLRLMEFGKVHRHELSGVLHGLFRVRAFTIDDTHIYCTLDQIEQEIVKNIGIVKKVMNKCGIDTLQIFLSTRPEKAMGSDQMWEAAINGLKNALDKAELPYTIAEGDGAFYGPKIEFKFTDSMDRVWTCGTIQLDFFQPENFNLTYVSSDGSLQRPVILHQAIYGSLERFFAVLLEHYKGHLPFWLSPVQARIIPVSTEQQEAAQKLYESLKHHVRLEFIESNDSLSSQIKDAQINKIPWMLIIGKKEVENNTITIRHANGKQEFGITQEDLITRIREIK